MSKDDLFKLSGIKTHCLNIIFIFIKMTTSGIIFTGFLALAYSRKRSLTKKK